jgi:hypothetical protein
VVEVVGEGEEEEGGVVDPLVTCVPSHVPPIAPSEESRGNLDLGKATTGPEAIAPQIILKEAGVLVGEELHEEVLPR